MGIGKKISDIINHVQGCPKVKLTILEIYWLDSYKVAKQGATLTPTVDSAQPYWKSEEKNEDAINDDGELLYKDLPKNSAVYSYINNPKPQLKVKLKLECDSAGEFTQDYPGKSATLEMIINSLTFTGDFTFPDTGLETDVTIELKDSLVGIGRYLDNTTWTVKANINGVDKTKTLIDKPKLEFFSIYNQPANFFNSNEGVWIEALRFLFNKISLQGGNDQVNSSKLIGTYCHSSHNLTYETHSGAAAFFESSDFSFLLSSYLNKKPENIVNCYDQASAVQVLCGALGIASSWVFMNPYGFINDTVLINNSGAGLCNNPFYTNSDFSPDRLVTMERSGGNLVHYATTTFPECTDGKPRSLFGNHAFVRLAANNNIIDACAGPALADDSLSDYARKAIDTECNSFFGYSDGATLSGGAIFESITKVNWT